MRKSRIYEIRGERVMLDFDLSALYETEKERNDNQQKYSTFLRSQIVTLKTGSGTHRKYLPYAFTEQGVAMLIRVLKSDRAIIMNIAIMRAFVNIRKILLREKDRKIQLKQIRDRLGEHDVQLYQFYDALENLLDGKSCAA